MKCSLPLIVGIACLAGLLPMNGLAAAAVPFAVVAGTGTSISPDGRQTAELVAGVELPIGSTVVAPAGGQLDLRLAGVVEASLAADSQLNWVGPRKRGKEIVLGLSSGRLTVDIGDLPENVKLLVETPIGTVVATGTTFSVAYQMLADGVTQELSVSCLADQVELAGPFVATANDTLRTGGTLVFHVVDCPPRRCVYLPTVEVAGQDLNLGLAGSHVVLLQDGSSMEAAMDAAPPTVPFVAFKVKRGVAVAAGLAVTAEMPAAFAKGDRVVMGDERLLSNGRRVRPKTPENLISAFDGNSLTLAGEVYDTDVVVYPDKVVSGIWIRRNSEFLAEELKMVPFEGAEALIIGAGPNELIALPDELFSFLAERGVQVESLPTHLAVAEYNRRIQEGQGDSLAAVIVMEDYMRADDYLAAAREAAAGYIALLQAGGLAVVGTGLPRPGFMPATPGATDSGTWVQPQGMPPTGGGIMTHNAPPPLNPYPAVPAPVTDVPQSPGDISSGIEIPIRIPVPCTKSSGGWTYVGSGCGFCSPYAYGYWVPTGGGSSICWEEKIITIPIPSYVRPQVKIKPISLPSLPSGLCCF